MIIDCNASHSYIKGMGSGRDKRKKAKGTQGGQGGVKTARKTEKNDAKATRRAEKRAEVIISPGSSCQSFQHMQSARDKPTGKLISVDLSVVSPQAKVSSEH